MARTAHPTEQASPTPVRRLIGRWRADERGATAIEFGLVAMPFFMFVFGIIGIGLHYFTGSTLEHSVTAASRKIRTGQAQTGGMTVKQFKDTVLEQSGRFIQDDKLVIHLQTEKNWSEITPVKCLTADGKMRPPTGSGTDKIGQHAGGASDVVLITVCYEWELASVFWPLNLSDMASGAALLRAATTFRTEPYQ